MSWKDSLLEGKFRGVPFLIESSDGEIGRRIALHEYPLRDKPYAEDMGRKARRFSLDMYVLGADYMGARDSLIGAFEAEGPGSLVHPYLGEMTVTVMEVRGPRESTREGGMARFSVIFVEAGEALFPSSIEDTASIVDEAASLSEEIIEMEFSAGFDITGPAFVFDHAKTLMGKVTDKIDAVRRMIPGIPAIVTKYVADFQRFSSSVESLIRTPADLAMDLYGLITDIKLLPDRPIRAFKAYRQLWDALSGEREISGTTPSRIRQAQNQAALANLVHRASIIEAARTSSAIEFESYDDAIAVRDELAEKLDGQMESASDGVYQVLAELRVAVVKDLTTRGVDLARLSAHVPSATLPALVIAHQLYDDPSREAEIVARNHVRHPGFVPGGAVLEVLTDA